MMEVIVVATETVKCVRIICIKLQSDHNQQSVVLQARWPSCRPTSSVREL